MSVGLVDAALTIVINCAIIVIIADQLTGCRFSVLHAIYSETVPFVWILLAGRAVVFSYQGETPTSVIFALLAAWWFWGWRNDKHDDDDRWMKRRKRAAEKVALVKDRLVVVPAPA